MTINDAYHYSVNKLITTFGEREAKSLTRILFEDSFHLFQFDREEKFGEENWEELQRLVTKLLRLLHAHLEL